MAKRELVTVDLEKEFEYIITEEFDEEKPTKFYYKALSNRELAKFNSQMLKGEGTKIVSEIEIVNYDMVKEKLIKVENILIDGTLKNVKKEEINDSFLNLLPSNWIDEIAERIRLTSLLKGQDIESLKKP